MRLSREVKTAIIVLIGILAMIMGFSYLKSNPIFDNNTMLHAVYNDVTGIQSGTQVTINGLLVGHVTEIKVKNSRFQSVVTLSVDKKYKFSKNSSAEIYDTGIIGGKAIQIDPVFDNASLAKSGDTLTSSMRPGITALVQENLAPLQMKVEGALTHADSLLINVNTILDDPTKHELQQAIAGLNGLIHSFRTTTDTMNNLLDENKEELDNAIKNINTMTDNFSRLSDSLANSGLATTVKNFQGTVEGLNTILKQIEAGEGSLGKLAKDEALYTNLSNASRELDLLLQDFRLNPKRYVNVSVFGKKQKEYELPENDPAQKSKN